MIYDYNYPKCDYCDQFKPCFATAGERPACIDCIYDEGLTMTWVIPKNSDRDMRPSVFKPYIPQMQGIEDGFQQKEPPTAAQRFKWFWGKKRDQR